MNKRLIFLYLVIFFGFFIPIIIYGVTMNEFYVIIYIIIAFTTMELFLRILFMLEVKFNYRTNVNHIYAQSLMKSKIMKSGLST